MITVAHADLNRATSAVQGGCCCCGKTWEPVEVLTRRPVQEDAAGRLQAQALEGGRVLERPLQRLLQAALHLPIAADGVPRNCAVQPSPVSHAHVEARWAPVGLQAPSTRGRGLVPASQHANTSNNYCNNQVHL